MEDIKENEKFKIVMAMGMGMKYLENKNIEETIKQGHEFFKPLKGKKFAEIGSYYYKKIELMNEFLAFNPLQGQTDDFIRVLNEIISLANECKEKIKNAK